MGLLLMASIAIGWGFTRHRDDLFTLFQPASAGIAGPPPGLTIGDLGYSFRDAAGERVLTVTGRIANVSGRDFTLPPVEAVLLDERDRELGRQLVPLPVSVLLAGAGTSFQTEVANPPLETRKLNLRFVRTRSARD
jgi:hypothetical protein